MRQFALLISVSMFFTLCCGGGGGGGGNQVIPPSLVASFTPAKSTPDALDISLQKKSQSGDSFTIDVVITDVNNVYSASFDLVYDGALLDYLNYTEGNFLNDGATTSFLVSEQSGRLVVGATRLGQVPGVNAVGNKILMSIAFKVKKTGSTSVAFENNNLLNSTGAPIQVEWFGGTASGS